MGLSQVKVELQQYMGTDRTIAESAWTSTIDQVVMEERSDEAVERVVRFLVQHGHTSPLEAVVFRFHFHVPIFIGRQIMRYRFMSPNEMSGRYRTMPDEWYCFPEDASGIVEKALGGACEIEYLRDYRKVNEEARAFYNYWLGAMRAVWKRQRTITNAEYKRFREVHRGVLGTNQFTDIVATMNLHCFAHILNQRLSEDAQKEIQEVARQMKAEVEKANNVPVALSALEEKYGW